MYNVICIHMDMQEPGKAVQTSISELHDFLYFMASYNVNHLQKNTSNGNQSEDLLC